MLYLKACPRCRGDIKFERDMYGHYLECLQCGFLISGKEEKPRNFVKAEDIKKTMSSPPGVPPEE